MVRLLTPVILFETDALQPEVVHKEKQQIYMPTETYLKKIITSVPSRFIGHMIGARDTISK